MCLENCTKVSIVVITRRNLQSPIYNSPATPCISNKSDIAFQNQITTQSSCRFRGGTSRPCSSASGHGCANTLSINCAMACVRTSTAHDKFVTVSYSMIFPKWQLSNTQNTCVSGIPDGKASQAIKYRLSIAYPPNAQVENTPLQVPIAIGSAVCQTCVR
jgi:hypothetical protein